ncbi:MAG: hypothetical protein L6Q81_00685 [Bacteroidia bacterium]|nr:hypothetical protein [Bacteroidia bacterium]
MHRILTRLISVLILAVFVFYTIPHEAVHIFYDHEDTEHAECAGSDDLTISEKHVHCDFLSGYETDYVVADIILAPENVSAYYRNYIPEIYFSVEIFNSFTDSRGPPQS